jgi:3-oxoacyl-(acyl-carrier-protein) synthase
MRKRRVKVTGIGPVTPAGIGATEFWQGIKSGRSYIRKFDRLGLEGIPMVAATVAEGVYKQSISKIVLPRETARHTGFAVLGASLALADAGLDREELEKKYCAVVAGASLLDFGGIGRSFNNVWKKGVIRGF